MALRSRFAELPGYRSDRLVEYRGVLTAAAQGDPVAEEYTRAQRSAVLFDRSERGLVIVRGKDRKAWLHNLVTNAVSTLDDNTGNYAFALDVKGRIQFDLNILSLPGELWLDLDRAAIPAAIRHLDLRLITEDAKLEDASARFARLGVSGPDSPRLAAALGVGNLAAMAALSSAMPCPSAARLVRHDFAGVPGFELIAPVEEAQRAWTRLVRELGVSAAGLHALDVLRIEAGIPWLGRDLDEKVLPAETGQVERGISFHKGCYLGQEVVERMRSRGSLARRLAKLRALEPLVFAPGAVAGAAVVSASSGAAIPASGPSLPAWPPALSGVPLPAPLKQDGTEVGRITSLVPHVREAYAVGLGYLKTSITQFAGITIGDPPREVLIAES